MAKDDQGIDTESFGPKVAPPPRHAPPPWWCWPPYWAPPWPYHPYSGGEPEPEVSDIGQAEAWTANVKRDFDVYGLNYKSMWDAYASHLANGWNRYDEEYVRLNREAERLRDTLLEDLRQLREKLTNQQLRLMEQTMQHRDELHAAFTAAFAKDTLAASLQQQRQSDVGASALYYNIPARAIDASIAETIKNVVAEAMQQHSQAIIRALQESLGPPRGGAEPEKGGS